MGDIVFPVLPGIAGPQEQGRVHWRKQNGETVEIGTVIAEVDINRYRVEIEATHPGVLRHRIGSGATVMVGSILGSIEPDGAVWPPPPTAPRP